ncbi:phosphohistidine phosphatase SixA [Pseudomonas sp. LS1212]|uniref:phosphohistidine phosphatase SixA n=1 Tax=Pseudomonas sp. LS1212 TaxID=2972478 RepID=UPI00215CE2CF|nr:phosphohistidine phosphatase SixA [Pseudomonas sp. LS1212]UVJ42459.1 phosphohistidine phosphatase SixA [Pseudomonas sp. LS1212]
MKLWVLRHGQAEPQTRTDAERELTAHGREEVLRSAGHLLGQPLLAIFASPFVRTRQTAELVHEALGFAKPITTVPWLRGDTDPKVVVAELDALEKRGLEHLLLVSHQPLVSLLIGLLEDGQSRELQSMHTASLAELEGDWVMAGGMRLCGISHA